MGAMVGALAGFRQQDAVHGLPLQLSADEVKLAAERGAHGSQPPRMCDTCRDASRPLQAG